ncbi:hypothetical protein RFI_21745 [Reticulomyxa filosa]|uniref:Cupin-like domain-containing protein n=1 Tax=Reticulomyxa filosa TaxID=46433 RepID=X6MQA2_RETFI|nr:hypothetical protein RFI_21745 [Reticulomyxa filosa]|eukprot:ETO15617.1 hypothetical protein RFI_21745 [Reticulomyxa filosa]
MNIEQTIVEKITSCLEELQQDAKDLYLDKEITILSHPPTALAFLRDYVSKNKPVLIKHAYEHWAALAKWQNPEYLRKKMDGKSVTVSVTPNGRADAIDDKKTYFVLPMEKKASFLELLDYFNELLNHDADACANKKEKSEHCIYCDEVRQLYIHI